MKISSTKGPSSNPEAIRTRVALNEQELNHVFGTDMPPPDARVDVRRSTDGTRLCFHFHKKGHYKVCRHEKVSGKRGVRHPASISFNAHLYGLAPERHSQVLAAVHFDKKRRERLECTIPDCFVVPTGKAELTIKHAHGAEPMEVVEKRGEGADSKIARGLKDAVGYAQGDESRGRIVPRQPDNDDLVTVQQGDPLQDLRDALRLLNNAINNPHLKADVKIEQANGVKGKVTARVIQNLV